MEPLKKQKANIPGNELDLSDIETVKSKNIPDIPNSESDWFEIETVKSKNIPDIPNSESDWFEIKTVSSEKIENITDNKSDFSDIKTVTSEHIPGSESESFCIKSNIETVESIDIITSQDIISNYEDLSLQPETKKQKINEEQAHQEKLEKRIKKIQEGIKEKEKRLKEIAKKLQIKKVQSGIKEKAESEEIIKNIKNKRGEIESIKKQLEIGKEKVANILAAAKQEIIREEEKPIENDIITWQNIISSTIVELTNRRDSHTKKINELREKVRAKIQGKRIKESEIFKFVRKKEGISEKDKINLTIITDIKRINEEQAHQEKLEKIIKNAKNAVERLKEVIKPKERIEKRIKEIQEGIKEKAEIKEKDITFGASRWEESVKKLEKELERRKKIAAKALEEAIQEIIREAEKPFDKSTVIIKYIVRDEYIGGYEDNANHGHGKFTSKSENYEYEEKWKNDKRHGYGLEKYPNGGFYEGQWKNSKMHGFGRYQYEDGGFYEGQWKNDKRHGCGEFTKTNGESYKIISINGKTQGEFIDNENKQIENGDLVTFQYSDDNNIYKGTLYIHPQDKNVFIIDQKSQEGIAFYSNGLTYIGKFKPYKNSGEYWENYKWDGQGKLVYEDGSTDKGIWINNKLVAKFKDKDVNEIDKDVNEIYEEIAKIYQDVDLGDYVSHSMEKHIKDLFDQILNLTKRRDIHTKNSNEVQKKLRAKIQETGINKLEEHLEEHLKEHIKYIREINEEQAHQKQLEKIIKNAKNVIKNAKNKVERAKEVKEERIEEIKEKEERSKMIDKRYERDKDICKALEVANQEIKRSEKDKIFLFPIHEIITKHGDGYIGGYLSNGKKDGYGVFRDLNGDFCEGQWSNDEIISQQHPFTMEAIGEQNNYDDQIEDY